MQTSTRFRLIFSFVFIFFLECDTATISSLLSSTYTTSLVELKMKISVQSCTNGTLVMVGYHVVVTSHFPTASRANKKNGNSLRSTAPCCRLPGVFQSEFLTNQTTCASVLSKRTTSEKVCQKRPPAACAIAGMRLAGALPPLQFPAWCHVTMPPHPEPAPCLTRSRHPAKFCTTNRPTSTLIRLEWWRGTMPETGVAAGHQPALAAGHLPAMAQAAGDLFWQTFSEVVLFDNTLAQVVWFVKNSSNHRRKHFPERNCRSVWASSRVSFRSRGRKGAVRSG
jgi:hypothetical protein